jgi:hypothetical protein
MVPQDDGVDGEDVFLKILLAGGIFIPPESEDVKKYYQEILQHYGVTLNRSDFVILDHCRLNRSTIAIGKYALDYEKCLGTQKKRVSVEGTIVLETDKRENTHIKIFSIPETFRLNIDILHSEDSMISEEL